MAEFFSASDIVGTAIEIERRGRNVYTKAAAAAPNPDVKRFLEFFAGEEARHQAIFEAMTHTLSVSGGNKSVKSVATLSYDEVGGLYDGRRYQRYMENQRLQDLMRWKLASKALNGSNYVMLLDPAKLLNNIVNKGLWFWGMTPQIDEDGLPDFSALFSAGLCDTGAKRIFPDREYLWPIPTHDMELCPNLTNNTGY